jgi:hypothetical protein
MNLKRGLLLTAAAALPMPAIFGSATTSAAVLYSTEGAIYNQTFDSLPNTPENAAMAVSPAGWKDDDPAPPAGNWSIPGWYLWHHLQPTGTEVGFNNHQRMRAGPGSQNTGAFWSFGATGSTERALGDVGSTTIAQNPGPGNVQDVLIGLRLTNATASTLTDVTVSFVGEQWRDGNNTTPETMFFSFSLDPAADIKSGTYTSFSDLDWTGPKASTVAAALDGNLPENQVAKSATITGLNWAPGTDLWLRWNDLQVAGNDHGLAIDNVNVSAIVGVPEPASMTLLLGGASAMLLGRRRMH